MFLKIIGKGSSFPGQIVLKFYPSILSKIKMPKYVVAVTGSNGKTSTVELIHNILVKNGFSVAYNYEGSNQIEGITTLLLNDCSLSGVCRSDVCLLEVDERYAEKTFSFFTPTHLIVTNIYRDQSTRNGNREWVYGCIERAIHEGTTLVLNADDPLTSLLSNKASNTIFYGMTENDHEQNIGIYDDGKYCPKCNSPLIYKYRHFDNLGDFECKKCGHKKHETKYTIDNIDLDNSLITIDGNKVSLGFASIYNAYNSLAAYALALEMGISKEKVIEALNNYVLKNKRIVKFSVNNKTGLFLASKHENPTSYNQNMNFIKDFKEDVGVLIVVNKISRKYFTSETSWLWDIDFDLLNSSNVKNIILSGMYANDLALRFEHSVVDNSIVEKIPDLDKAIERFGNIDPSNLFIITCFSDQDNVLGRVTLL